MDMVSYYSRFIDVDGELHHAGDFLITRNKIMIEAVLITFGLVMSIFCLTLLLFSQEGTKGLEKDPYYGRKTGTIYTAKKSREKHII